MKSAAAVAFALLIWSVTGAMAAKQAGSLCVERAEDEGSVNIYPVQLKIDQGVQRTFLGGTKFCLPVMPGAHKIELSWPIFDWQRPDHGASGKIRDSQSIQMFVKDHEETKIAICGVRAGNKVRWRMSNGDVKSCS